MDSSGAAAVPPTVGVATRCATSNPNPLGTEGSHAMINAMLNDCEEDAPPRSRCGSLTNAGRRAGCKWGARAMGG